MDELLATQQSMLKRTDVVREGTERAAEKGDFLPSRRKSHGFRMTLLGGLKSASVGRDQVRLFRGA